MKKQTYIEPELAHLYIRVPDHLWHTATHYTRIPSIDPEYPYSEEDNKYGWFDIIYLYEPIVDPSGAVRKEEWIYVLVNKSMLGMVKIGMTTNTVEERTKQINTATGIPTPWIPVYKFKCYGSRYLEKEVHDYLAQYRVAGNREMFAINAVTAQEIIEKLGTYYSNMLYVINKEKKENLDNDN
jgi:hypothetical protein